MYLLDLLAIGPGKKKNKVPTLSIESL